MININLKQKNDSNCTFYHFSLLVACHDNFLVVCLCILIFPGIVELKNFFVSCSKGLVKFQISWGHSVLGGTKNFDKVINDQSCKYKLKNSWWQNCLSHVCMLTFLTFSWEFSTGKFFICSSVLPKSQESVSSYLVITLWKCEYCLTWVLNKSILFGSNSLKVSLLCNMCFEKSS